MSLFSILKKKRSGAVAKQRLKTILISDHADCSSDLLEAVKEELCQTLSRYIEVEFKQLKMDIISSNMDDTSPSQLYLVVKIPFKGINKVIC